MGRLSKNVFIYFIGSTINRFMGLIVLLLATHILTNREDLGFFNFISNTTNILLTIASLQIWMAIIRFIYDYKTTRGKLRVISSGYFIGIISLIIYIIILIIFSIVQEYTIWFFIELLLLSFGYIFNQLVQFSCRGLGKNKLYAISGVVGSFVQLLSSVIFLFFFNMTYSALILSTAISYIGQGFFIEFFLRITKQAKLKYVSFKLIGKMLRYSIPTTLNFVAYWFNQHAYIWLLRIFYDDDAVGAFTPAFRMTSLIGLFVMSFNYAFQEYSFVMSGNRRKKNIYNSTLNSFFKFISSATVLLLPATCIFFSFMVGKAYKDSKFLVPILYLASMLDSLQIFLGSIMQAEKKVNSMFLSQLIGIITTITTIFFLKDIVNIQSAAIAMASCFFVVTIVRFVAIRRTIKIKFSVNYLLHFVPIYIISTFIFVKYNELVNFLYAILVFFYFLICNKNLIIKMLLKFVVKNKRKIKFER